jgi:hypothetical protein
MALLVLFHPLFRRLYDGFRPISITNLQDKSKANSNTRGYPSVADADARMDRRASFDYGVALIFIGALHGFSAMKVVVLLYVNFCIATRLPRKYVPASTWIFNIGILFANELCNGYKFTNIAAFLSLAGASKSDNGNTLYEWGVWLDSYGGIMPRWEILFNITVLRLISFNLDYYWSLGRRAGSPLEVSCSL